MKNLKQVKKDNKQFAALIDAVIEQLGDVELVKDVNEHGMSAGFGQFVYYADTHKFALANQVAIVEMLEQMADDLGEDVVAMVNGFGVFRPNGMDKDDKKDLYKYLSGVAPEQGAITNVMAWFAAEEVCRMFEN